MTNIDNLTYVQRQALKCLTDDLHGDAEQARAEFQNTYMGSYIDHADYGERHWNDLVLLNGLAESNDPYLQTTYAANIERIKSCVDFDKLGRKLLRNGHTVYSTPAYIHVFSA